MYLPKVSPIFCTNDTGNIWRCMPTSWWDQKLPNLPPFLNDAQFIKTTSISKIEILDKLTCSVEVGPFYGCSFMFLWYEGFGNNLDSGLQKIHKSPSTLLHCKYHLFFHPHTSASTTSHDHQGNFGIIKCGGGKFSQKLPILIHFNKKVHIFSSFYPKIW